VPVSAAEELTAAGAFHDRTGQCVFCAMLDQERAAAARIVSQAPGFVAFCPYAARSPFETWIVPTRHASHFETIDGDECRQLAGVLLDVLSRIEAALVRPAYNYIIHTAPFDTPALAHYHWHIEIIPRATKTAGFEWGTGFYINPVAPEEAAERLRGLGRASEDRQEFPTKTIG
jgi:UDPglucose--hexose-1-phosphate uridylyltransferase